VISAMGSESEKHQELKRCAAMWAQVHGYRMVGTEVALPNSRYRADVAAYRPERKAQGALAIGQTAVFECKQARSDFLKDARSLAASLERLKELHARRASLESLLAVHYPSLRSGETLFPEYDRYDFAPLSHKGYAAVIREIRIVNRRVYEKTKFDRLLQWRCANVNYLVVSKGILEEHEVPEGWGLLCHDEAGSDSLRLARRPVFVECAESTRLELLQRLAAIGTRELNRQLELDPEALWTGGRSV